MLPIIGFMLTDVIGYLSQPWLIWMPITSLIAIAMICILGFIYALSGLLGRTEFKDWVRVKIYDLLFSIVLIIVFFSVFIAFFAVDPQPSFRAIHLVPQPCTSASDFYILSACDMNQFLISAYNLNTFLYSAVLVTSLVPTVTIDTSSLFESIAGSHGLGFSIGIDLSPVSISTYFGQLIGVLFLLFAVNQMQMLLLSSALLIFSTFMAIGLIARLFGITRSFGGAMIAFALGVGVLYPLMVCLTYGFLNTGLQEVVSSYCLPAIGCLLKVEQWSLLIFSFLSMLIYLMLGMTCPTVQAACTIQTYLPQLLGQLVTYGGIMSIGLTLVPFFNFLIVDTFIVDFSRAFGERMDLLSLLGNLI